MLINPGDIYNELYYIYKNKCNKKINSLDSKNRKKLDYKKLRLADIYNYPFWGITTRNNTDANVFNEWIKNLYQINDKEKKN